MKPILTYLHRFVMLVVAIQILNLSVYARDCQPQKNTIGDVNRIDSMAEYIGEIVLDYKNAFPEDGAHNTRQSHSSHLLKHESIHMINFRRYLEIKRYCVTTAIPIPSKEEYKYLFFNEIIPPPPKA